MPDVLGIPPNHPRVDRLGDAVGPSDITRPDVRRETEMNVVGNLDRFGLIGERNHGEHWPEYLFLSDPHSRGRIREQRREDVVASTFPAGTTTTDGRPLTPRDRAVAQDLLSVALMDQRAHLGVGIEGVADLDTPRTCREGVGKSLVDRLLHQRPAGRRAALAVQAVDHEQRRVERPLEISIVEDHYGVFASKLQMDALQSRGTLSNDVTPRNGVTDETDGLDRGGV